jgi:hypothetical protein
MPIVTSADGPAPQPNAFHTPRAAPAAWRAAAAYDSFQAHSSDAGKASARPSASMIGPTSTHWPFMRTET